MASLDIDDEIALFYQEEMNKGDTRNREEEEMEALYAEEMEFLREHGGLNLLIISHLTSHRRYLSQKIRIDGESEKEAILAEYRRVYVLFTPH